MLTFDDFAELLVNKVSTIIGYIQEGDEDKTEEEQKKNGLAPDNIEYTLKETDLVLYAARTPSPDKATYKKDTIAVFLTRGLGRWEDGGIARRSVGDNPNFGRSVLGGIDAESCHRSVIFQHMSRSTKLTRFWNAPNSTFAVFRVILQLLGNFPDTTPC